MFLHEAKPILRMRVCCYVLAVLRTPENVFSRSNFSDNVTICAHVLSSIHSNVQLLYLLLFFAVGVGVAVLLDKGPCNERSCPDWLI